MVLGPGFDLGNAQGKIILDFSEVSEGAAGAQNEFNSFVEGLSSSFQQVGRQVTELGASMTVLTAPITGLGVAGLRAASDFDSAMREISARTGIVGDELQQIGDFALQMGADTVFSGQQAAEAFLQLLSSGQSAEQAIATLPSVLNLAAASGDDLGRTADTVTDIMAAFNLEIDQSSAVTDALARAAASSSADVASLGQGFANVGGVARNFGLDVEETAAILAIFAENGVKGSEAGTQLRSMLINMSRPTAAVQGAWAELGTSLYDAAGNVRPLNDVIADLDTALDQLPVEEQNRLMMDLAGSYGIVGLTALRSSMSIEEMQGVMAGQADAASIAEIMMGSFANTIDSLMGSVEALMITALTPFMNDFLQPMAEQGIELVNTITEWVKANPELTATLVRILAVASALGPVLVAVGIAISAMGPLIGAVAGAFALLLSPIGLVIGAFVGLGIAYRENFLGIRDTLEPVIERAVELFTALATQVGRLLQNIDFGELFQLGTTLLSLTSPLGIIKTLFETMFDVSIFDMILGGVETLTDALARLNDGESLTSVLGMEEGAGAGPLTAITDGIAGVVDFITNVAVPALQQFGAWFLSEGLPAIVEFVTGTVLPAIQGFFNFLGQVWAFVGPALQNLGNWFINDVVPAIVNIVTGSLLPAVQSVVGFLAQVWALVSPALMALADWFLYTALPAIQAFISDVVLPAVQGFIDILVGIWNDVSPFLLQLLDWFIYTGLPLVVDFIESVVVPAVQSIIDILAGIWEAVQPTLQLLYDWFIEEGLPRVMEFIQGPVTEAIQGLIDIMAGIWDSVQPGIEAFRDGIKIVFDWIKDNVIQPLLNVINSIADAINNIDVEQIMNDLNPFTGSGFLNQGIFYVEGRDAGGPGMAGMPYRIGPSQVNNEIFVPSTDGQFIPNFMDMMAEMSGGDTIHLNVPLDVLRDEPNIERNAERFAEAFMRKKRGQG